MVGPVPRSHITLHVAVTRGRSTSIRMSHRTRQLMLLTRTSAFHFSYAKNLPCRTRRLERCNPRDVLADDQGMDVVGAFVGFDRLQVGHVAEDGVFVRYAVAAEDIAAHA